MTPEALIAEAEANLRHAQGNLASCVAALNEARSERGGVPNAEVIGLAHVQAVLAQAYAAVALAKERGAT